MLNKICEEKGYDREEYVKERAINEIRRNTIRCLFLMNDYRADEILIEIMNNEKEPKFKTDPFYIQRTVEILWKRRENGEKLFNMKRNEKYNRKEIREPNWNGALSAAYCYQYAETYNSDEYNTYDPDCANFGSQCLIAGGLNLRDYGGNAYIADTCGVISSVPLLHTYLSSRPDVRSEIINFCSHQSWNPDEHIPEWFTTGDIAILGTYFSVAYNHTIINHAGSGSAAIYCTNSSPDFEDCLFINNSANGGGGAMCLSDWSSPFIKRTRFTSNTASEGGAVFVMNTLYYNYCYPNFEEIIFYNNTALNNGGAVYLHTNVSPVFFNNTFFQNSASVLNGGAIYCTNNCNFHIDNSIFWQNPSPELFADESCIVQVHNSDLTNGDDSYIVGQFSYVYFDGNILASDPQFVDDNDGNFNLEWNSPCIDMGATVAVRTDDRQYQRNRDDDGTLPDIGAESYYQPDYIDQPADLTILTENDSII